jgi:hypothetical protein
MSREEIIQIFNGRQDVYSFIGDAAQLQSLLECSYTTVTAQGIVYFTVNDSNYIVPDDSRLRLI